MKRGTGKIGDLLPANLPSLAPRFRCPNRNDGLVGIGYCRISFPIFNPVPRCVTPERRNLLLRLPAAGKLEHGNERCILTHGIICAFPALSLRERAGKREKSKRSECAVWWYTSTDVVRFTHRIYAAAGKTRQCTTQRESIREDLCDS